MIISFPQWRAARAARDAALCPPEGDDIAARAEAAAFRLYDCGFGEHGGSRRRAVLPAGYGPDCAPNEDLVPDVEVVVDDEDPTESGAWVMARLWVPQAELEVK